MKPNLINIKTLENELKQIQINKDNFISLLFNLFLVVVMIAVAIMIFYVFRDKRTKENRRQITLNTLHEIAEKADDEINRQSKDLYRIEY